MCHECGWNRDGKAMRSIELTRAHDKDGHHYWLWFSMLDTGQAWHGVRRTRWAARRAAIRWQKGTANKSTLGVSIE